MNPKRSIFPFLHLGADNSVKQVLGTCFAVGPIPTLVTAAHVMTDNPLPNGEHYGIVFHDEEGELKLGHLTEILLSEDHDVAAASGSGIPNVEPLKILGRHAATNQEVLTYEFSNTRIERFPNGRRLIAFEPLTRKGNIMIHHPQGATGRCETTPCFDVSFAALQGASGAPVILQSLLQSTNFAVVGMLVANVERHLLPAQVVRIQDEEDEFEETKYFLPFGRGIEGEVIVDFLESIYADPEVTDFHRG